MFAVMSRFDRAWEEAAYDLGATRWQTMRLVVIPILAPGLVAVALFGFTLSYDEFARTLQTAGSLNTLPLEIWSMTLNVTSPSLYALGTVTTIISFVIIGVCLGTIASYPEAARQPRPGLLRSEHGSRTRPHRARRRLQDASTASSTPWTASISRFPMAPIAASSVRQAAARPRSCA